MKDFIICLKYIYVDFFISIIVFLSEILHIFSSQKSNRIDCYLLIVSIIGIYFGIKRKYNSLPKYRLRCLMHDSIICIIEMYLNPNYNPSINLAFESNSIYEDLKTHNIINESSHGTGIFGIPFSLKPEIIKYLDKLSEQKDLFKYYNITDEEIEEIKKYENQYEEQ